MNPALHLTIVAALCAGAARAEMTCAFEAECFETEACAGTTFALDIVDGDPIRFVTEFGDLAMTYFADDTWLAQGQGMSLLLSRGEDGAARASVHLPGPLVTTYLGTCRSEG
ncbi:hypothetical protein [Jannaschia sp. M317]|uniref:hypothetical protein n=1 Tax=Jannaschia sp. M317 TaxID=2867011 RepID=UPI0021A897C4|nr:hypothetical protein [Jannaschia sp. M317]UWQ17027.1 hypothetical protein K3551_14175 [Jannaschia sp. M317]